MTSIVDTPTAAGTPHEGDPDLLESIYQRVLAQQARFLDTAANGQEIYSPTALALVIHEIVTEHAATVVREVGEAGGEVRHVVNLLVASEEANDRLREDNAALRNELHTRER